MFKKTKFLGLLIILTAFSINSANAQPKPSGKGSVLFVLTSHSKLGNSGQKTGYYLEELTHPLYAVIDAGYSVEIASPKGGEAPMDPSSKNTEDPENKRFLSDKELMDKVKNTISLSKAKAENYSAIVFPGGHGPMFDLAQNKDSENLVRQIYEKGGIVAAVCHGPAGIANVKLSDGTYLIKDKRVTGFTNAEEDAVNKTKYMPFMLESVMIERGGKFEKSPLWQKHVTVDGRVITGQNPKSAKELGQKLVHSLSGKKSN